MIAKGGAPLSTLREDAQSVIKAALLETQPRNAIQQAAKLDHEKRRDNSGETIV